jgi:cholera toxin transcriptional activator
LFLTGEVAAGVLLAGLHPLPSLVSFAFESSTLARMTDPQPARRYRFGTFEAETATGELRRQGLRIRLSAQPFQVLLMLLDRPGELLTREDISRELWPEGTFVDYEHGVNSAVNRIREALSDTASSPRFVETLARRGYRFVAPVECVGATEVAAEPVPAASVASLPEDGFGSRILASRQELPQASHVVVRTLFLLLQAMYLSFYIGALANLPEIQQLLAVLPRADGIFIILIVTAAVLIPARAFVLCMVLFQAPAAGIKFLKMWPFLLLLDVLWSLSPFLLLHHIDFGVALACTALLVYSPFAQRALVLMGACDPAN